MNLRNKARKTLAYLMDASDDGVRLEAARLALSLPPKKPRVSIPRDAKVVDLYMSGEVSARLRRACDRIPTNAEPLVADLAAFGVSGLRHLKLVGPATINEARELCRRAGLELGT